ncbi:MAG: DUF2079 domain-containing protein [Patescibacteria group bacterium]|nr:DUF2079 domain-containing protein [Patescibacteria group bacterium]MDD5715952.1 DUF2079 domain-containing protein [Patescibacteria group bacterium]
MEIAKKITLMTRRYSTLLLWICIAIFISALFIVVACKYAAFGYDAIDLGIYSQVFFNSSHGALFEFSVHPHSYLGDHVELFILLLLPFYALLKSPLTLLALQIIAVAIAAVPLYSIARRLLPEHWSLAIVLAYLCNPFVLNMAFFEFHLLPFAIPLLMAAFYFYREKRLAWFLVFSVLALSVREDVPLVIGMFGVLAAIDRRRLRWILPPIIISGVWFIAAFKLTGYFSGYDTYKFLAFYSWLGSTPGEIVHNALFKPWLVLRQIMSANNLLLVIGLLLPLGALPLLKTRYLIPAALITAQLFLATVSSTIVLQTHYPSLIIPFLFIACVFSLATVLSATPRATRLAQFARRNRLIVLAVFGMAVVYSFLTFSPAVSSAKFVATGQHRNESTTVKRNAIAPIQEGDAVVASYEFLPALAQRKHLYPLHYLFLGVQQYSDKPYIVTEPIDTAVVNFQDFVTYYIQTGNISSYRDHYRSGAGRILSLINENRLGLASLTDSIARYDRNAQPVAKLVDLPNAVSASATAVETTGNQLLRITAWDRIAALPDHEALAVLPLALYWEKSGNLAEDYAMEVVFRTANGKAASTEYYPIGYGIFPPSVWIVDTTVQTNHWFLIPRECKKSSCNAELTVVSLRGYYGLDGIRSTKLEITQRQSIGPTVTIPAPDR